MVTYLPRTAWGARPARGSTPLVAAEVDGVALHWPGMAKPLTTQEAVAAALRGWQDYHMDVRGWSDIAYQVAVDQAGRAWTLRGLPTRSAANGDADVNRRYGALLLVLAPGEQPSAAMKATTRGVVADFRRSYPNGTAIQPHSAVRPAGTDCPGDAARAAIARGDFTPTSPEGTTMSLTDQATQLAKAGWLADQFAQGAQFEEQLDVMQSDGQMLLTNLNELRTVVDAIKAKVDTL